MIGASSTWYATRARPRISRSSAARAAGSEDAKELLGGVDDRVGLRGLELRTVMDPPPRDGHRVHPCRLRREGVERRIAAVCGLRRIGPEALGSEEERLGIRLVPLGLVPSDDYVEQMTKRDGGEGELSGVAALGRDDP